MRPDPHTAKAGRNVIAVGLLTLTALHIGAASGLPDNPKDPPPPPSGAGYLFNTRTVDREAGDVVNGLGIGIPVIFGVPELGNVLTASKGAISDPQGTTRADRGDQGYAYRYQWVRVADGVETDIPGATSGTYVLTYDDLGDGFQLRVRVWYNDDLGRPEGPLTSDTFNTSPRTLVSNTGMPIAIHPYTTGNYTLYGQQFTTGGNPNGYTLTAIGIYIHQPPSVINENLVTLASSESDTQPASLIVPLSNPDTFSWTSTNYFTPPPATRLQPNTKYWVVVHEDIEPHYNDSNYAEHWMSPYNTSSNAEDSESLMDWSIGDGYAYRHELLNPWRHSNDLNMMMELRGVLGSLHAANYLPTGAPSISGEAGAGHWLRASTSEIADSNGLSYAESDHADLGYTYQWARVDLGAETDIAGATHANYLLTDDDVDKQVSVKVRFVDDAGNTEGPIASAAFPSDGTVLPAGSPDLGPPTQVLVENTSNEAYTCTQRIVAQGFTTGSNASGYRLDTVGIAIGDAAGADILVRIFARRNNQNRPGRLRHTLVTPAIDANAIATFMAPGYATLLPNTEYFVVMSDSTGMEPPGVEYECTQDLGQDSDLSEGWSIYDRRSFKYSMSDEIWRGIIGSPAIISLQGVPIEP